jgi:hypothetical protein
LCTSLTLLYAGLYRVMERREKYFYIEVGEQKEAVSRPVQATLGDPTLQGAQPPRKGRRLAANFSATAGM